MAANTTSKQNPNQWLTQKELAVRWHVSPSTIINWRNEGKLPFFRLPGSARVLYPLEKIISIEHQNTTTIKEVNSRHKQPTELKRKKPVVSTNSQKEWRI